jgi:predicted PurR-regulated permease PerM
MAEMQRDLTRTALAVLFIAILIGFSFWILRPFLGAIVWATMIVVATWPLMVAAQARLWGKRALAVTMMTLALLLVLVVPLSLAIGTIVSNADTIAGWAKSLASFKVPPPPEWLSKLPVVGGKAVLAWEQVAAAGIEERAAEAAPYAGSVTKWFVAEVGSFGMVFVQFLLTVVLAAVMYASGESAADVVRRFGRRLAGERGDNAVVLAGQAIRAVALGVGVTAIVQSVLGGIALAIAGVPFAGLLTAVMFMFCIAQLGPTLVLVPAVIWTFWSGDTGWGIFLLLCTAVVGTMDNFLRPILIRRGADLPLLLILAGVIGGLLAFGLVGIFVGPVVLAVAYKLLGDWIAEVDLPPRTAQSGSRASQ